ncbi:hypothetical protein OG618_08250 [Kitasatospora sp. NBC_01246]|nr:hypothetical protein [Kitasatospora sp. NBC_01246]
MEVTYLARASRLVRSEDVLPPGEGELAQDLASADGAVGEGGGYAVAGAVDHQDGCLVEAARVEGGGGVREVVLDHGDLAGPVVAEQGGVEEFGDQLAVGAGVAGLGPCGVEGDGDLVHLGQGDAGLREAVGRGHGAGAGVLVVLASGEPLLLGEGDDAAVDDQAGRGVVVVGAAQPQHNSQRRSLLLAKVAHPQRVAGCGQTVRSGGQGSP